MINKQRLYILFLIIITFPLQAETWSEYCQASKDKSADDLNWYSINKWVQDSELKLEMLKKTVTSKPASLKSFAAAILLRRGFEELAVSECRDELSGFNESFWYVFTSHGGNTSMSFCETHLKEKNDMKYWKFASLLYKKMGSEVARKWLIKHYDPRNDASAVRLAETGLVDEVRSILRRIKHQPTHLGERAADILKFDLNVRQMGGLNEKQLREYKLLYIEARTLMIKMYNESEHCTISRNGKYILSQIKGLIDRERSYRESYSKFYNEFRQGELMLWEILMDIQNNYVDDNRIDPKRLFEAAARGIASALDRHCAYMGEVETKRSDERFSGNYVGLGAIVSKSALGTVLIERVFFGAPAYKVGIRSGDQILEVDGQNTIELTLNECVKLMRGLPGTDVTVKVVRAGWDKAVDYVVNRQAINTPSLFVQELPGGIIYAKLTSFIATSDEDLVKKINEIKADFKRRGIATKGLIFDLRDNGGGYLETAINICDQFLEKNKLIVYSEGRKSPRMEAPSTDEGEFKNIPLVIMINKGSASASEIVSGCLKDHKRAVLVGERSYGKGSVQTLRNLDSTDGKTKLKFTIAYYYLPNGECIHRKIGYRGGVKPHVEIKTKEETSDTIIQLVKLHGDDVFVKYIKDVLSKDMKTLHRLAKNPINLNDYPQFNSWYEGLKTKLSKERVCQELRMSVRSKSSEELGQFLLADWYSDVQLITAIKEMSKISNIKLSEIKEYADIR